MPEERSYKFTGGARIIIEKCETGFVVLGDKYGGDQTRAFSTAEGLIEWLSRELGGGPIVWGLTLSLWCGLVEVEEGDLVELPDPNVSPQDYQTVAMDNAKFLLNRFADLYIKHRQPQPPPEPKPKKEKKAKGETTAAVGLGSKGKVFKIGEIGEEKPKEEKGE